MSGEKTEFSVATRTLKLRKPVRKAEESAVDELAPPAGPIASDDSFQIPSADLLAGPHLPENRKKASVLDEEKGTDAEDSPTYVEKAKVEPEALEVTPKQDIDSNRPASRPVPYNEPKWSGCPGLTHGLEVIKNGKLLQTIDLSKRAFTVFGRASQCDVEIEHPSASRYHAVLQCRPSSSHGDPSNADNDSEESDETTERDEFFVYDMGSSNNTFVNKEKLQPKTFYRVRLGHQLRFGFSTRIYVLVAGQQDTTAALIEADAAEEEREVLELRLRKAREFGADTQDAEVKSSKSISGHIVKHKDDPNAISWGFQEDDVEEEAVMEERPDFEALINARNGKAQYFEKDPKKALENFFDREGLDMEIDTDESGSGSKHAYIGRVKLPIQTATGEPIYGEGTASKKKEAIAAAALDACRLLDAQGMLREHQHEKGAGRKRRPVDEDFYDSDEDSFLDRTGTAEKKRQKRMARDGAKNKSEGALTHEALSKQLADVRSQLQESEDKLQKAVAAEKIGDESLDDFMSSINSRLDRSQRAKLRNTIAELKKEESQVAKLVSLAAPNLLPELQASPASQTPSSAAMDSDDKHSKQLTKPEDITDASSPAAKKKAYGFVGVIKRSSRAGPLRVPEKAAPPVIKPITSTVQDVEEEDEDDEVMVAAIDHLSSADEPPRAPSDEDLKAGASTGDGDAETATSCDGRAGAVKLPTAATDAAGDCAAAVEALSKSARRRKRRHYQAAEQSLTSSASKVMEAVQEDSLDDWKRDPNVDAWLPPQNQSGDGKTHLNAKFGY